MLFTRLTREFVGLRFNFLRGPIFIILTWTIKLFLSELFLCNAKRELLRYEQMCSWIYVDIPILQFCIHVTLRKILCNSDLVCGNWKPLIIIREDGWIISTPKPWMFTLNYQFSRKVYRITERVLDFIVAHIAKIVYANMFNYELDLR